MSTIKKTTDAKTTPPLVAAKMVKSTSASAPKTLPPGVKVETGDKEDLGTHWEKKSGGKVQEMSNQLQKYGLRSNGGSSEFMNWEEKDKSELAKPLNTLTQIGKSDKGSAIAQHTGGDVSGRLQVIEGLKDIYKLADKKGYATSDQVRTDWGNLVNQINPRSRKLFNDPMLQRQLSNLKDVASQHFVDLKKTRDAQELKKPPVGTITDESGTRNENASYMNMPAYNKAQVPAGIKLTVKKK